MLQPLPKCSPFYLENSSAMWGIMGIFLQRGEKILPRQNLLSQSAYNNKSSLLRASPHHDSWKKKLFWINNIQHDFDPCGSYIFKWFLFISWILNPLAASQIDHTRRNKCQPWKNTLNDLFTISTHRKIDTLLVLKSVQLK